MKDNLKLWVVGAVAASVLLVAGGYFVGVQPMLANAQLANTSAVNAQTQTQALRVQLAGLRAKDANRSAIEAEAAATTAAVPSTLALSSFVDEVNTVSAANSVTVSGIAPSAPQAYTPPVAAAPTTAATTTTSTTSTTSAATTAASTTAAVAEPTINSSNFVVVPVSLVVTGTSDDVLAFIHAMQGGARTFLISGVATVSSAASAGAFTATLTGFVYALQS